MSTTAAGADAFKICPSCRAPRHRREDLLGDPEVELVGYQAVPGEPTAGLLLFNHLRCGTTMALRVADLEDLHDGPVFSRNLSGEPDCPCYCDEVRTLDPCPMECSLAWIRDVLQVVRQWPKRTLATVTD